MKHPLHFSIIVAVDRKLGIGKNGALPWHLPGDMKHFKEITTRTNDQTKKNAVIMGPKTLETIPEKFRPLPQRINLVLTRNKSLKFPPGILSAVDFPQALTILSEERNQKLIENVFVIGGAEVFKEALNNPCCRKIYLTQISASFDCDVFFPELKGGFTKEPCEIFAEENSIKYSFEIYARI